MRPIYFHRGHRSSYWWGASIGQDDANGWPIWFIEWGGRGRRRTHDAPLLAVGGRWGYRWFFSWHTPW